MLNTKQRYHWIIVLFILACNDSGRSKQENVVPANNIAIEKSFIKLGGEEQYVEIASVSKKKPGVAFYSWRAGLAANSTPALFQFGSGKIGEPCGLGTIWLWKIIYE